MRNQSTNVLRESLGNEDWVRQKGEIVRDQYASNSIRRCFEFANAKQQTSAELLVANILQLEPTLSIRTLLLNLMITLLEDQDPFVPFSRYFIDFPEQGIGEQLHKHNAFAWYHQSQQLPKYSDDENNIRIFNATSICKTNINEFIEQDIIIDNDTQDSQNKSEPVEHFSVDFRTQ